MSTLEKAEEIKEWIIDIRRDFHMHPEPSYEEFRTSNAIADKLQELGIEVKRVGKTGVLGTIVGKEPGKVIALRADIDALSVEEKTGLSFSSKNPGFMHACGHDTHAAMLLGAAKILSSMKDELKGTVKFIFQPAEEANGGAKSMVDGGVLENPKVDMVVGMHIFSMLDKGYIVAQEGSFMASVDQWKLNINGKSCHGSSPWEGHDAIVCAAAVINGLQTIVSRVNDARNPIVINVGTMNAGERFNVVPGKAALTGANRTFSKYSREMMPKWMEKVIKSTCEAYDCTYDFEYTWGCNITENSKEVTDFVKKSVSKIVGENKVIGADKIMGSEDFGEYSSKVPGMIMILGGGNKEKGICYSQHSNHFMIDEDSLPTGAASYAQVVVDFLQ
ncbi:M20 family metallopeptidase [Clostridium neuense]|uniref:M20 family metallopeptidase n=1 Tax=Clostridium neuense TaxID=1728934 RepID=A0ABW8TAQ0_9CLOT